MQVFFELSAKGFPLCTAIWKGDLDKARGLIDLSLSLLEEGDSHSVTPLYATVFYDDFEAIEMLLSAGVDALARTISTSGESNELMMAAKENKQPILRQL